MRQQNWGADILILISLGLKTLKICFELILAIHKSHMLAGILYDTSVLAYASL